MAKHNPRTIWKPVIVFPTTQFSTASMYFLEIRSVDADASMGLSIKRIECVTKMGLAHSAAIPNSMYAKGLTGFFKWPADAATPTAATIDVQNASKIFDRRAYVVMGENPIVHTNRAKSARLRLGEALWYFNSLEIEAGTPADSLWMQGILTSWETQA